MLDRVRALLAVAMGAALVAPSCAPDGLSGTCRFSGDQSTPCGKCIAKSCQPQVNACCEDSTCRDYLAAVDTCSLGGACSISTYAGSIATCVASSCANVCQVSGTAIGATDASTTDGARRFATSCSTSTANTGCLCSPGDGASYGDVECSEDTTTVDGGKGLCCAEPGWPESGTSCSCSPFTCKPVDSTNGFTSVLCGTENFHQHLSQGTDTYCCTDLTLKECKCGPENLPCDYGSKVDRCSVAVMECGYGRTRVTSCSIPAQ